MYYSQSSFRLKYVLNFIEFDCSYIFQAAAQMINNPIAQVGFLGGPIAPTTVAAALSAASFSGVTAVTSSII